MRTPQQALRKFHILLGAALCLWCLAFGMASAWLSQPADRVQAQAPCVTHYVHRGDTLLGLAAQYGARTDDAQLAWVREAIRVNEWAGRRDRVLLRESDVVLVPDWRER